MYVCINVGRIIGKYVQGKVYVIHSFLLFTNNDVISLSLRRAFRRDI